MKYTINNYSVGALLYSPANNETIVQSIIEEKFDQPFSLALCLEDTIRDDCVEKAEDTLVYSLTQLAQFKEEKEFYLPKIFIRVREPKQIGKLFERFQQVQSLVTGFIIPKFDLNNADDYIHEIKEINHDLKTPCYMMPIFESSTMIPLNTRYAILYSLKSKLDQIEDLVLNIRVGGNDLCHSFGLRRHNTDTIYEIRPIANILTDIVTVFGLDYVVSGPVWEYYNGDGWDGGLRREIEHDQLNGFIGKTVIHPKQISIVNQSYAVSKVDYDDACSILHWNDSMDTLVLGSSTSERMNEYKTHTNWAKNIILLSKIYGFKQD
ncbi:MAG: HpcH/HpaI aldolase/citrate lyase family protein [Clostridiales bacterium]|nr:HpcH/HpaI aldolase/citrate lyase family protein [Clostridiales bacterium]